MDVFGPAWSYLLIVALGAFAVCVHSYSMYGQRVPIESTSKPSDPLSALALPTVAGQSAFRRGFIAYLFANETLYLLLTSSSIILELSLNALGRSELVGALNSAEPLNSIVPILASTVVITASQLKPLAQIERAIRNISHRIAGIPRNLDSVQEQIRLTTIDEIEQYAISVNSSGGGYSHRLISNARKQAAEVCEEAAGAGLGVFESHNLNTSLMRVICLYEWSLGYDGEQIWVSDDVMQITVLFDSLKLEYRTFKTNLQRIRDETTASSKDQVSIQVEAWEEMLRRCLMLERRLTIVLSLLLINKPDIELRAYPGLDYVRDKTVEVGGDIDRNARNALGLTVLFGSFSSFTLMIIYLSVEKTLRDSSRVAQEKLLAMGPFGTPDISVSTLADFLQYVGDRMDNAFYETLDYAMIVSVAVLISLVVRDALKGQKQWPSRTYGSVAPVSRYLYVGLLAYLPTMLIFLLMRFLILNVVQPLQNGNEIMDMASLKSFPGHLPEITLVPVLAFVCVWFVCNYLDQNLWKLGRYESGALPFAMVGGGTNFVLMILTVKQIDVESAVAAFFIPALTLFCLFSFFAHTYEKQVRSQLNIPLLKNRPIWSVIVNGLLVSGRGMFFVLTRVRGLFGKHKRSDDTTSTAEQTPRRKEKLDT